MRVQPENTRVASFMPIVAREARKLAYGNSFTADDLAQEGIIAAMSALESYDPRRGSLGSYVRVCARNRMISYLRRNGHESPMEGDIISAICAAGAASRDAHQYIFERRETVSEIMRLLSPFEAEALRAYLSGGGVTKAACILGCGRKKVDNALQRIRNKARSMAAPG
ncbi:MAG: sigma-70 family RNA polymerase sigma factor [Synergistaceae bacterium]|jgi:RNA polymerase sigma factor (sigma-70 family)|nr:sigma-70 family RNA polymerase sigma factor [Synergistaceae bacterium]